MFWVFVKNVNFIKLQKNILILLFMPSENSERKTELWIYEEMQAASEWDLIWTHEVFPRVQKVGGDKKKNSKMAG